MTLTCAPAAKFNIALHTFQMHTCFGFRITTANVLGKITACVNVLSA